MSNEFLKNADIPCLTPAQIKRIVTYETVKDDCTFVIPFDDYGLIELINKLNENLPFTYTRYEHSYKITSILWNVNNNLLTLQFIKGE